MRLLSNISAFVAIVATLATACNRAEIEENIKVDNNNFKLNIITSKSNITKTEYENGDAHWSNGDQMVLFISGKDRVDATATIEDDRATFTATGITPTITAGTYNICGAVPSSAIVEGIKVNNGDAKAIVVELPSTQKLLNNSFDGAADILVAENKEVTITDSDILAGKKDIESAYCYYRPFALSKFTITDADSSYANESVTSVTITASKYSLCGRARLNTELKQFISNTKSDIEGGAYSTIIENQSQPFYQGQAFNTITLTAEQGTNIAVNDLVIWFASAPILGQEGTLQLTINTTDHTIVRTIDLTAKAMHLQNNCLNKANISLAEATVDTKTTLNATLIKLLPRLAVIDWGDYAKGTGTNFNNGTPRSFVFELAKSENGTAFRHYDSTTSSWLTAANMFFAHNRFAFGNLEPNTTYWFRLIARELGTNKVNSEQTTLQFTTPAENIDSNAILYKDFDNFCVGGGYCYAAFGPKFTNGDFANKGIDPTNDDQLGTYQSIATATTSYVELLNYANNASHNYGPVKSANVWRAYWETDKYGTNVGETDYQGWKGFWVRLYTGSVLLSTSTVPGWLKSPKLIELGEDTADITLTCHTMAYFEPYHSWGEDNTEHYIKIEGPGEIYDGGATQIEPTTVGATANSATQITVKCTANVNASKVPIGNYPIATEHVVKISGATKDTRIIIEAHPYKTKHPRLVIDDLMVTRD